MSIYDSEFKSQPDIFTTPKDENTLQIEKPIGYLKHVYTSINFPVYKKIPWYKKCVLNLLFGLKYVKLPKM